MKQIISLLIRVAKKQGWYEEDMEELERELNKLEDIYKCRGKILKL